jgi:hypothetical protein
LDQALKTILKWVRITFDIRSRQHESPGAYGLRQAWPLGSVSPAVPKKSIWRSL